MMLNDAESLLLIKQEPHDRSVLFHLFAITSSCFEFIMGLGSLKTKFVKILKCFKGPKSNF